MRFVHGYGISKFGDSGIRIAVATQRVETKFDLIIVL
jgi:hypothetical protein